MQAINRLQVITRNTFTNNCSEIQRKILVLMTKEDRPQLRQAKVDSQARDDDNDNSKSQGQERTFSIVRALSWMLAIGGGTAF